MKNPHNSKEATVVTFKHYVSPTEGIGVTGLILTLNLAQCQKLKDLYSHARQILNTPENMLHAEVVLQEIKDYIVELIPLLENFEIFDSPNDIDLF